MYCSSCGVAVAQGLSYCNYCGAKLGGAKGDNVIKSSEKKPEMLVAAMVFVFVLGLGGITFLMFVMRAVLGFNVVPILAFTLLSFLIMLFIEGVCFRLLFHRKRGTEEAGKFVLLKGEARNELDAAQVRMVPEPVPSATEHTTRAFEPIQSQRKAD